MGLRLKLEISVVERLDLYEWNCGQELYKMQSFAANFGRICPARVQKLKKSSGKYVLQKFKNRKNLRANMSCQSLKVVENQGLKKLEKKASFIW